MPVMIIVRKSLLSTESTFLLVASSNSPCYCTVHAYVAIHVCDSMWAS